MLYSINEQSSTHYIEIFLADIRNNDEGKGSAAARRIRNAESSAARRLLADALNLYLGSQLSAAKPHPQAEIPTGSEALSEILAREVRPENGKPYLPDYPDFHYNISHSGGIVVCAISNSPVGIDIQQISYDPAKILKIAAHFFSQEEQQALNLLHEEKNSEADSGRNSDSTGERALCHLFCRFWTARESYIKLTGRGLAEPFSAFRPDLTAGRIITAAPSIESYYLTECPAPDGYCMTVCSTAPVDNVKVSKRVLH